MICRDKYSGCHPEIKKSLKKGKMIRCYIKGNPVFVEKNGKIITTKEPNKYKGWVIDYLPFEGHRYKVILDLDIKQIVYYPFAEPIIKEIIKLTR